MSDTEVVSVKVPAHLREEIRRTRSEIDWPEELRGFIQDRLRRLESEKLLAEIHTLHSRRRARPRGFAAKLVRDDRDRH